MRGYRLRNRVIGCSVIAISAFLPQLVMAAEPPRASAVEEVVVTAQKRSENLQKAALSVDTLKPMDLRKAGVTNAMQLQEVLPAVKIMAAAISNISIRGLGTPVNTSKVDSAVALSMDGIYLAHTNALPPVLFDLARVEAVLGPQGTLYGRNSNAGVVNFITNDPTFKYGCSAQV